MGRDTSLATVPGGRRWGEGRGRCWPQGLVTEPQVGGWGPGGGAGEIGEWDSDWWITGMAGIS